MPRFCDTCGARLCGDPFESVAGCLVPRAYVETLRRIHDELCDSAEPADWVRMRNADRALAACEDLNREVLHAADRLRSGDERDLVGLLSRGRAFELLEDLPTREPWVSDLRVAVWQLVSDLERAQVLREYELLERKAKRAAMFGDARKQVKAWQDCVFWLETHGHPRKDELTRQVRDLLAAATT